MGLVRARVLVLREGQVMRHRVDAMCRDRSGRRRNRSGRAKARCRARTGCTAKAIARSEVVPVRVLKTAFRGNLCNLCYLRLAPAEGSDPNKSASAPAQALEECEECEDGVPENCGPRCDKECEICKNDKTKAEK